MTPRELQELFDAMVLMRAQEALKLSDDQYPQFLTRLKALQEVRRQAQIERLRMLNEVRRMLNTEDAELDGSLRDRLTELANLDVTTAERTRQALERLDEVLDLRQQAMFRVFEERMEQQKLDLLTRARQGNRQNRF